MKQLLLNLLLQLAREYLIYNEETEDFETRDNFKKQQNDIARQIFIDRMTEYYDKTCEREKKVLREIYNMPKLSLEQATDRAVKYAKEMQRIRNEQAQTPSTSTPIKSNKTD